MKIDNTFTAQPISSSQSGYAGKAASEFSSSGENGQIELKPINSLDDLSLDVDFEVIQTQDFFAEMEKRREEVAKTTVIMHLFSGYMGTAFQKMFHKQQSAVKYALTDRAKFNELMHGSMDEYKAKMKPFYELNRKYAEDGDYEAYINSSLFDPYRKSVFGEEAE